LDKERKRCTCARGGFYLHLLWRERDLSLPFPALPIMMSAPLLTNEGTTSINFVPTKIMM
jgi:hypothetical protein